MASATGIPEIVNPQEEGLGEDEPLLGRAGDASQQEGRPLYYNLIIGIYSHKQYLLRLLLTPELQAPQSSLKLVLFCWLPPFGPASSYIHLSSFLRILFSTLPLSWRSLSPSSFSNPRTLLYRNDKARLPISQEISSLSTCLLLDL